MPNEEEPTAEDRVGRREAASLVGVSPKTLERYVKAGRLTKYKRDNTRFVVFDRVELMELARDRQKLYPVNHRDPDISAGQP